MSDNAGQASAGAAAVEGLDEGDRRNVDSYFRRYFHELVGVFTKVLNDADQAADIASQTFEDIAKIERGQEVKNPRALLFDIAWKRVAKVFRSEGVRRKYEGECERRLYTPDNFMSNGSPEQAVLNAERLQILDKIIIELPRKRRRVLVLHLLHGLSLREIASQEGILEKSARKHLERAVADCQIALARIFESRAYGQAQKRRTDKARSKR